MAHIYLIPVTWRHCAGHIAETLQSWCETCICLSLSRLLVCCWGASISVSVDSFLLITCSVLIFIYIHREFVAKEAVLQVLWHSAHELWCPTVFCMTVNRRLTSQSWSSFLPHLCMLTPSDRHRVKRGNDGMRRLNRTAHFGDLRPLFVEENKKWMELLMWLYYNSDFTFCLISCACWCIFTLSSTPFILFSDVTVNGAHIETLHYQK